MNISRYGKDKLILRIKRCILKFQSKGKITFGENLKILGSRPIFKLPKNGRVILGDNVVLNSDFINSNTTLTTKV